MAFVKLFPNKNGKCHSITEIVRRLRGEFNLVDADPDKGQDHVAGMILATLRFSDEIPGKKERLKWLQTIQNEAVFVTFGDDYSLTASCCLKPDSELFFGSPDEVDGPARELVKRAAVALGYVVFPG